MKKLSIDLLCRLYLLAALLTVIALAPLPYSPLALCLFIAVLFIILHPRPPEAGIIVLLVTVFLLPMLAAMPWRPTASEQPIEFSILAAITSLPVLYLLDYALRQKVPHPTDNSGKEAVSVTPIPGAIFTSASVILLVSGFTQNRVLVFTSLLVILYQALTVLRALRLLRRPLGIPLIDKRLIARTTGDIIISVGKAIGEKLYCRLVPEDAWIQIKTPEFTLDKEAIKLNLTVTPPLSGPVRPRFRSSVMDCRGLVQVDRLVEAVELHVIPRARYAQWLATRYLEQTARRDTVPSSFPAILRAARRGTEYLASRDYYPGDPPRNIDWRHTLKLSRLITREYTEAGGQSAIIVANMAVADADAADKLAFNLITTALTLARHGIPAALAAYDNERVISTTAVSGHRASVTQAMLISRQIVAGAGAPYRSLQPPDIHRLRRNMSQLKQATSVPARQMMGILDFEYRAILQAAKNHPATQALNQVTRQVSPPAIIVLVSPPNGDAEALAIALEKLTRRGFASINISDAKT